MHKLSIRLSVALLTFLLGVCAAVAWLAGRSREEGPHVIIPDEKWVNIFFEAPGFGSKSINNLTAEANLPNLRTILLPEDDLEVRVWVGFGVRGVDGLILRRSADRWIGIHLHGMAERPPYPFHQEILAPPKSGWETAWLKLKDAGILTLPDSSSIQCDPRGVDGTSYVVEGNMNKTYRTYRYHDPNYGKCDEAKQMMKIGEIIDEEFGLEEFSVKE